MQHIQSFTAESGGVLVPLGTKVRGNVQVVIHHIRSIPIARKANLVSVCTVCLLLFVFALVCVLVHSHLQHCNNITCPY